MPPREAVAHDHALPSRSAVKNGIEAREIVAVIGVAHHDEAAARGAMPARRARRSRARARR